MSSNLALSLVPVLIGVIALLVRRAFVTAQPDEWLLCIRNGALMMAGVGVSLWRRPGDVVVRFSSTLQRVGFNIEALCHERLPVSIDGFIMWSVSSDGDDPFRAFQKLGLVNRNAPSDGLTDPRHLLSSRQHRAFQRLLGAAVQRLATTKSLDDLLLNQSALVAELRQELSSLESDLGIRVNQLELSLVRPADGELLRQMSAHVEVGVRESAQNVNLETDERLRRRAIESDARIAQEEAEARKQRLGTENALRLAQVAHEREVKLREQESEREQKLALEARELEIAQAVIEREELQFSARLQQIRREAKAQRDAVTSIASAEEKKSQALRDHELATFVAEKIGDALKRMPINEARWITVGPETPAGSLATLITTARELVSSSPDQDRYQ